MKTAFHFDWYDFLVYVLKNYYLVESPTDVVDALYCSTTFQFLYAVSCSLLLFLLLLFVMLLDLALKPFHG